MKLFYIFIFIFLSTSIFAKSDLIINCKSDSPKTDAFNISYILNLKEGIAEILHPATTEKGVVGTREHFYILYFTKNKKSANEIVIKIIINRITGKFTQTQTSDSSYPDTMGEKITGSCESVKYERKL